MSRDLFPIALLPQWLSPKRNKMIKEPKIYPPILFGKKTPARLCVCSVPNNALFCMRISVVFALLIFPPKIGIP